MSEPASSTPETVFQYTDKVESFIKRHRTGLLTLLFTDIVGSVDLKQKLGDRKAVELIQRHHALVREVLRDFKDGDEIETAGDSFFLVFAKPSEAVKFALVLQRRLADATQPGEPMIADRIGIHVGEVFIQEELDHEGVKKLFGLHVDTAARIMGLAQGGHILLSRLVFDSARQVLGSAELPAVKAPQWLNHGPYVLKGLSEPVEVCEVGPADTTDLTAPPDSDKARRILPADGEIVLGWRPAVGTTVPKTEWLLERKLGEGGFGEVWVGFNKRLNERRVFKFCFRADRVRSLKREVTLFRVMRERVGKHPNIVGVQDLFFEEPPFYLIMDYAPGLDLRAWCDSKGGAASVPMETRLEIVAQVADALQAAHDAGVIHRDVKPSNILIEEGSDGVVTARLTDFGIGQVMSAEVLGGVTRAGFTETLAGSQGSTQSGTHIYMAPELHTGTKASPASDIYSLGVVLFQFVAGDFSRPLTVDWIRFVPDLILRDDLAGCFVGDASSRLQQAAELAQNLRSLRQRRLAAESKSSREKTKNRLLLSAIGGVMPVLVGILLLGLPIGDTLRLMSYDLSFSVRNPSVPNDVVIVKLDEQSHAELNKPLGRRWDRALHAQLLQRLRESGAKAVVFDIIFSDPDTERPQVDQQLAQAIKAHGKVVLGGEVIFKPDASGKPMEQLEQLLPPLELFATSAAAWGDVSFPINSDSGVRLHRSADTEPFSLSWATAKLLGLPVTKDPVHARQVRYLKYYGPSGTIPHVSYYQALDPKGVPAGYFKDKVVFVGQMLKTGMNNVIIGTYVTPFTRKHSTMDSSVEIHATAFLNLLRQDWLTRLPETAEFVIVVFTGLTIGSGLMLLKPRHATRAVIAAFSLAALGGVAAMLIFNLWFAWLIPVAQSAAGVLWCLWHRMVLTVASHRDQTK